MLLSDISIKRPVFASVMSLLLIAFGLLSYDRLPLREYPDIDPPIVSIETIYPGAAANVVETRITELVEDRISGVEGIQFIESASEDGRSTVTLEFDLSRNIDDAANDVRDRISTILDDLPVEAFPPEIQKVNADDEVILWLNLESDKMTIEELTDYAERYLVDRFSVLDGVARVRVGGGQTYAMRIWLDRNELAARNITVADIERALRAENVELPAGSLESRNRQFTVRLERSFKNADDFAKLVVARGEGGYLVRLGDVARVEKGVEEKRLMFRGNGTPMVGLGITKQSTANTLDVARAARAEQERLGPTLPDGMRILSSYDTSVFIQSAIDEVYMTLGMAIILVVAVIYLFLGSARATIVPAVTVPVSLIGTFIVLYMFGYSVNLLTLLALVLAIGLVVDDAIVVLENIYRRMQEYKESPLVAAYRGTRQVAFAVIATTLVLISVFVPITFMEGDIGRLFTEFAVTMAAAVGFSSFVALSLSPMLASQILKPHDATPNRFTLAVEGVFTRMQNRYRRVLDYSLSHARMMMVAYGVFAALSLLLVLVLPTEYAPKEDRGAFFIMVNGPEGASYSYIEQYMDEIEKRLMPYTESGEVSRLLVRAPRGFGNYANFGNGMVIVVLNDWSERRPAWEVMDEIRGKLQQLPGVTAIPIMRQGFGNQVQKPLQYVIGGGTYEELVAWRDILVKKINEDNPGFVGLDWNYKETKPQLRIRIDYDRAAELGVSVSDIGSTLETMLGSRRVTTFVDAGEEYEVMIEGERSTQSTPTNMENIYVRSNRTQQLIPLSNLIFIEEYADSFTLSRYNRVRAITLEANLSEDLSLGEAIDYLDGLVEDNLPDNVIIDYKGQSQDYKYSGDSILFIFLLGIMVVYLVLAAQFESYVHPFIIMLTVPLAIAGALIGIFITGGSLNVYTEIGLIMLVGLAAKNGILIVEFANQLRDEGKPIDEALYEASLVRFRPIVMTGITTVAGSVPLLFAFGAGAETRSAVGVVILFGVAAATLFTVIAIPVAYQALARFTDSPLKVTRRLEQELKD